MAVTVLSTPPSPRGEIWEVKGGGQQEEGKDLRRLVDPKGSADYTHMNLELIALYRRPHLVALANVLMNAMKMSMTQLPRFSAGAL